MPVSLPVSQVGAALVHAAATYKIPVSILVGVYGQETSYGTNTGNTQYMGPFQFGPGARSMYGYPATNSPNAQQFQQQALAAAHYLSDNFHKYGGSWDQALRQYSGEPLSGPLGPGGYGFSQVQQRAQQAPQSLLQATRAGGGGAIGGPQTIPGQAPQGSQLTQQVPSFDQAGYQQAQQRYIAGSFLKASGGKSNPWNVGPKGASLGPNPLIGAGLLSTTAPNPAAFQGTKTVQLAQNSLQALAGNTKLLVHPGAVQGYKGYVNPLPGFTLGRTDMGVDANARPGTPIRAIGDSKLVQVMPNWYAGQPLLLFQFLNGPKAGSYWYVAEQIQPHVGVGQVVHAGDPVATYAGSGTGIEIGFGSPTSNSRTLAGQQGNTGSASHSNAPAGVAFRQFLGQLGAH